MYYTKEHTVHTVHVLSIGELEDCLEVIPEEEADQRMETDDLPVDEEGDNQACIYNTLI